MKEEFSTRTTCRSRAWKIVLNIGVGPKRSRTARRRNRPEDLTDRRPVGRHPREKVDRRLRPRRHALGAKVTRGDRMYDFLDRLITIAMPRIRDFRGVGKALMAAATTPGLKEHIVFPEIDFDKSTKFGDGRDHLHHRGQ